MFRLLFPQLEIWFPNLREKLRMSGKQRFMLLLLFFNALLLAILVLSVRNLEIVERIATVQVEITRVVERLQTVQALEQQLVYITETPTPQQIVAVTPTPEQTSTTVPSPTVQAASTSTATATRTLAPTQTPTQVAAPSSTARVTPTATTRATPTTTRTQTPTPTATGTATLVPTPTATNVPAPTSTSVPPPTSTPSPMPASITLAASPSTVVANGTSFTTLTATVRDQYGQPVPNGVQVTFSTDLGTFGGSTTVSVATVGGQAQVQLSSATVGIATAIASVNAVVDSVNVFFVSGAPSSLVLTRAPDSVPADGAAFSTLQATVTDAGGNPVVDGTVVNFATTLGTLSGATASTVGGVASVTLRSTWAGTATVTATAGSASGTTTVSFTPVILIRKMVNPIAAGAGSDLTYAIEIENSTAGGTPALLTTLVDVLPAGFVYLAGSTVSPAFPSDPGVVGTQLTWTASPSPYALAPGGLIVTTFQVRATAPAGTYFNTATVNGTPFAPVTTGPAAAVTLYNPAPGGIAPASACNNADVAVTISGAYFSPGATARLGPYNLSAVWVNETTLTAVVPRYIAIGSHDLVVTNPGGASGTLPGAYTALDCSSPDVTLTSGWLGTYGRADPTAWNNGDDDQKQILFIDLPDGSGQFYIRVFDPDCGGGLDRAGAGTFNTPFTWSVYGGSGTITDPDARVPNPGGGATSGTLLATVTFMEDVTVDGQWYPMGPFNAGDGELVNGRRVFKLSLLAGPEPPFPIGSTDTDLNLYNVAVSTSPIANAAPPGARLFSYSWTFLIPAAEWATPPPIFAYVGGAVTSLVQHNFDYDSTGTAGITIVTPVRTLTGTSGDVSGNGFDISSSYAVQAGETGATWTIICWADPTPAISDNLVTFWATDQGGAALPLFARPTTQSPPVP